MLINAWKLRRMNKVITELCDGTSCQNCKMHLPDRSEDKRRCAASCVIDQALEKWGHKKED